MGIDTITGDEFARLDAADHRAALQVYETAITSSLSQANHLDLGERAQVLDRLGSQLQLRKLHRLRLAELEEATQTHSA